eukprot:SAG31_NODE_4792_length_2954_cov_1.279159_2_plen_220_part_00
MQRHEFDLCTDCTQGYQQWYNSRRTDLPKMVSLPKTQFTGRSSQAKAGMSNTESNLTSQQQPTEQSKIGDVDQSVCQPYPQLSANQRQPVHQPQRQQPPPSPQRMAAPARREHRLTVVETDHARLVAANCQGTRVAAGATTGTGGSSCDLLAEPNAKRQRHCLASEDVSQQNSDAGNSDAGILLAEDQPRVGALSPPSSSLCPLIRDTTGAAALIYFSV